MVYQTGRQVVVSYKKQSGLGTPASGSGATVFRANNGGLSLTKQPIQSNENRRDGMMTRGRHGQREVRGQYAGDLSLGTFDGLFEAVMRSTFLTSLALDETTTGSATTIASVGANSITATSGSWITKGLRVGDVIRFTSGLASANLNKNLRITGLTATVITVAETLEVQTGPIATWDLVRPKKLIQGLSKAYFTFEEHELDIDASEIFTDCVVGSMQIELQPNGMGIVTFGIVGIDMDTESGGSAPIFTSPTATTTLGMTSVEAKIRLGSSDVADLTACRLNFDLRAAGTGIIGGSTSPDIFTNLSMVEGSLTGLRQDFSRVTNFLNEDQLSLSLMFRELDSEPMDFINFFIPNLTLSGAAKSALGADGPRTQELPIMVGVDERGGAYANTMLAIQTSAT